jgi:LuxR family maltose regulon positive regulatory protein
MPATWLSLDEEDNDLRQFLKYVVAAVRTHSTRACRHTHELLGVGELPPLAVLANCLANDLEAIKRPFILVVDDYHRIHDPAVHELLNLILRRPSRSCHLAPVTRRDPPLSLAILRAQGRMVEIREQDPRFTRDETSAVVRKIGGISIGDDTLTHLHAGLEGWIVG